MFCTKCGIQCEEFNDNGILRHRCPSCNYVSYRNPYPCVSLLVVNQRNEIALGKRHPSSIYPGKWCLPCGYIEYGESYVAAGIREAKEEIGIDIEPIGIINVVSNELENNISSLVVVLLAYYKEENPLVPGDDISEAAWFPIDKELPPLAFKADDYIINKYHNSMKEYGEIKSITLEGNSFVS
ncbi:NUDIX hydrolase [Lachnospiraceae bacterium MD1]|jgi:8-oxo-dGTP diphosphatase|uniref:NUDIX hydrolase n=1 Tax=Variimorphobacter saccharofermentans TaxID=2755051 RepID=A0A839K190_9FIRM|nr:NUDIX hydrolase [Variimorphobacter saccharofermentans]MBB2183396.1 NUDIX hydrolase [Variimorphobacter saccharofermentans]